MNFSKMMKNVKVMDKIIDGKDFKLLEKQDDDMLLSIGKHILIHHFSDIKEYHKQLNIYESLPRGLYKWWVVAIVVIINILVLLSLRGARQTVIVQTPQPVQSAPVQPNALPCENVQPKLEKSDEMKIF